MIEIDNWIKLSQFIATVVKIWHSGIVRILGPNKKKIIFKVFLIRRHINIQVFFDNFVAIFGKKYGSFSPKVFCQNSFPAILRLKKLYKQDLDPTKIP